MLKVFRNCLPIVMKAFGRRSSYASQHRYLTKFKMTDIKRLKGAQDDILLVNDAKYVAPHHETDHHLGSTDGSWLVTVIVLPEDNQVTERWLSGTIAWYRAEDDVFTDQFLAGVIFQGAEEGDVEFTADAKEYLHRHGNEWIKFTSAPVLPGPYAQIEGWLRDVWKLEDDSNGTTMTTVRPQTCISDPYEPFQLKGTDGQCHSFPLRSRLKTSADFDSPIKGWRIVVKDNINLNGVNTTLGNRAFRELFPPRSETAESIQKVIKRGVVVVGKTKMSSFGNWEEPIEYIDYQAPWNPRGDRYQSPGASSSGSAAAIAAYEWLDIAIGTDSWGSITRPALWCGCFGLRPSTGAASTHGIEPYTPTWDMPGLLAQDLTKLRTFAKEWLKEDSQVKDPKRFTAVIWASDFWSTIDQKQVDIARDFVKDIQTHLDVKAEDVSFVDEWERKPPKEAEGQSLMDYISPAMVGLAYDIYHNEDYFRNEYMKKFGCHPYTSPRNEQTWNIGKEITKEQRDAGFAKIAIYTKWFNETILSGDRSNALIVFPQENMSPRYRDELPTFLRPPQPGICSLSLGAVLKSPAFAVPLDQIPYDSRVTGNEEHLPFVVTLTSPPGTDLFLLETAQDILKASSRPTSVKLGKVMFDVAKSVSDSK